MDFLELPWNTALEEFIMKKMIKEEAMEEETGFKLVGINTHFRYEGKFQCRI